MRGRAGPCGGQRRAAPDGPDGAVRAVRGRAGLRDRGRGSEGPRELHRVLEDGVCWDPGLGRAGPCGALRARCPRCRPGAGAGGVPLVSLVYWKLAASTGLAAASISLQLTGARCSEAPVPAAGCRSGLRYREPGASVSGEPTEPGSGVREAEARWAPPDTEAPQPGYKTSTCRGTKGRSRCHRARPGVPVHSLAPVPEAGPQLRVPVCPGVSGPLCNFIHKLVSHPGNNYCN